MATYIQGVTDYLPVIQPFQPDYNFLSNVLQTKQSRYDAAHKQLSSVYGTLLNSPMLRDKNIKTREEFFEAIDQDIQRMSGMDLSLQQNQDAALNVFKGFYEDKNMVKDMLWTKNYLDERSRAESFKECVDKEKCGGFWWEGGVKALDYRAQEFKMASDEEALNFADVSFVPAQDLMGEAMKSAKESGFSIKYDEVKGDWIVTTKNGSKMVQPLAEYFVSKFGSDPKMMNYYKEMGYLQRKDWVNRNLANYSDESEANLAYVAQMYSSTRPVMERGKEEADRVVYATRNESEKIDRYIKENGYIPTMNFVNQWKDVKDEHAIAVQTKQVYDDAYNKLQALGYNRDNIRFVVDQIDGLVGLNMIKAASLNAASAYASLTSEVEIKANPYALQAKDHAFQLQMKKKEKDEENKDIEETLKKLVNAGNLTPNIDRSAWSATDVQEKLRAYNVNIKQRNKLSAEIDSAKKKKVITILTAAQEAYANGSVSYDDLSYMLLKTFQGTKSGIDPAKFIKNDPEEMTKFNKVLKNSSIMVNMYDVLSPYADHNSALGAINKDWTSGIQPKINQIDHELNETRKFYRAFDKWHKREVLDVVTNTTIADLRNKGKTLEADAFKFMFDGLSKNGLYPNLSSSKGDIFIKRARQWAEKNQDKFSSEAVYSSNTLPLTGKGTAHPLIDKNVSYIVPRRDSKGRLMSNDEYEKYSRDYFNELKDRLGAISYKTAYQKAYEFALTSLSKNKDSWRSNYDTHGKAWDNPKGERGGNAKAAMVSTGFVDSATPFTSAGKVMMEMIENYNRLSNEAIVVYGKNLGAGKDYEKDSSDQDEYEELKDIFEESKENEDPKTDASAKAIVEQWMTEYYNGSLLDEKGKPKDDRAVAYFEIGRNAAQNSDMIGFRLKMPYSWGKKHKSSDDKTDKLIDDDKYFEEGIVVYLPKDKVKGTFMSATEYNMYDFIMDVEGQVKVDRPGGGSATLTKVDDQYHLTTVVDVVNPDGTKSKMGETTVHGMDFNLPTFVQTFQQGMDYQAIVNQQSLFNIAAQTGIKDPNQVFNP